MQHKNKFQRINQIIQVIGFLSFLAILTIITLNFFIKGHLQGSYNHLYYIISYSKHAF